MPAPLARRSPPRLSVAPLGVAWSVIEEASLWLGEPLPEAWTAWLVERADGCIAHTRGWRKKFEQRADGGRSLLYTYMRHWLSARLKADRPDLFALLPAGYRAGEPLPERRPYFPRRTFTSLSNDARLLFGCAGI